MKITGFCPIIVTQDQEAIVKVFEDLGFERCHLKTDIEGGNNENVSMKDAITKSMRWKWRLTKSA